MFRLSRLSNVFIATLLLSVFALSGCGGGGGGTPDSGVKKTISPPDAVTVSAGDTKPKIITITETGYKTGDPCLILKSTQNLKKDGLGATVAAAGGSDGVSVAIALGDKKTANSAGSCSYTVTVTATANAKTTSFTISDAKDTSVKASLVVTVGGQPTGKKTISITYPKGGTPLSVFTGTINEVTITETGYTKDEITCNALKVNNPTDAEIKNSLSKDIDFKAIAAAPDEKGACTYKALIETNWVDKAISSDNPTLVNVKMIDGKDLTVAEVTLALSITTSAIGRKWTPLDKTILDTDLQQVNSITYGNGVFVAVGNNYSTDPKKNVLYYSADGNSWTKADVTIIDAGDDIVVNLNSVAYGQVASSTKGQGSSGLFVAVGSTGTGTSLKGIIITSSDGKTWTKATGDDISKNSGLWSVAYGTDTDGKGVFVAVPMQANEMVLVSIDGSMWNPSNYQTTKTNVNVYSVNNHFIIYEGGSSLISATVDGASIKIGNSVKIGSLTGGESRGIAGAEGVAVLVMDGGLPLPVNKCYIYKGNISFDSSFVAPIVSPKCQSTDSGIGFSSIVYAEGVFVATAISASTVVVSTDLGVNFTPSNIAPAIMPKGQWFSAYGNGKIVAVSASGDVMISSGEATPTAPPSPAAKAAN